MFSYDSVLEKIDENVELRVAHKAIFVFLPTFALSKATIIAVPKFALVFGTQRVLPLFAMICNKILVAILCRFFFLNVI
jgi:hypothetical protein